jgi:hypothetical protein
MSVVYSMKAPDGTVVKIKGPEGATNEEVALKVRELQTKNRKEEPWYEDFGEGIGLSGLETYHGVRDLAGIPAKNANAQLEDWRQDAGQSGWGTAGQVVGELGQIIAPGGALLKAAKVAGKTKNAMQAIEASKKAKALVTAGVDGVIGTGLAASQAPDIGETRAGNAESAAIGALGGELAGKVLSKAVRGINVSDAGRRIMDAGAYLTPGQASNNKILKALQSIAEVTPVMAPSVRKAEERALKETAELVYKGATAPNKRVSQSGVLGIAELKQGFEEAYEDAWKGATAISNTARVRFVDVVDAAKNRVPEAQQKQLDNIVTDFAELTTDITPEKFKALDNVLRKRINAALDDYDYQEILKQLRTTLRDGAPSGVFDKLQAVDAQYGSYLLAKSAAQKSLKDRGEFTSKELITSLQSSGDAAGYGQGPLQELVMDIAEISKSADDPAPLSFMRRIAGVGLAVPFAQKTGDAVLGNTGLQKTLAQQLDKIPDYLKRPAALGSTNRPEKEY